MSDSQTPKYAYTCDSGDTFPVQIGTLTFAVCMCVCVSADVRASTVCPKPIHSKLNNQRNLSAGV